MQNSSVYYDYVNALPQGTVNRLGWVVCGLPFLKSGDAIRYAIDTYPESGPRIVMFSPAECRRLAVPLIPEYDCVIKRLNEKREAATAKVRSLAIAIDGIKEQSIFDTVQKEVLQKQFNEAVGLHSGLVAALETLRDRKLEMLACRGLKDD